MKNVTTTAPTAKSRYEKFEENYFEEHFLLHWSLTVCYILWA